MQNPTAYKVRIFKSAAAYRKQERPIDTYFTGCFKTAKHAAIADCGALGREYGEGCVVITNQETGDAWGYDWCAEFGWTKEINVC